MIPRHLQITVILLLIGVLFAGGYMLELRRREQVKSRAQTGAETRPLPAPTAGPAENVKLAIAYDEDGRLVTRDASVPLPNESSERIREVLRALLATYTERPSPHPIKEDADIKNVFLVKDSLCVIDLNAAFAAGHPSGILAEQFTLASLVETIALNFPRVQKVKFLVEGQERETLAGHADLMTTYEVQKVHDFVLSLQNLELSPGK
jgi:hypothetical protein